eukprot:5082791-Prymnesium_polylepis.1
MAEVTLPQFPEPRIHPNLSRATLLPTTSRSASGQNPVSRIAGWGPQGAPRFQRGQIPDVECRAELADLRLRGFDPLAAR